MCSYTHPSLFTPLGTAPDEATGASGRDADLGLPSKVWGAVVNFERVGKKSNTGGGDGESHKGKAEGPYVVDVLVNCSPSSIAGTGPKR